MYIFFYIFRWQAKCHLIWQPLLDLTPAAHRDLAPPPLVRGVFYGYDPLGEARVNRNLELLHILV